MDADGLSSRVVDVLALEGRPVVSVPSRLDPGEVVGLSFGVWMLDIGLVCVAGGMC